MVVCPLLNIVLHQKRHLSKLVPQWNKSDIQTANFNEETSTPDRLMVDMNYFATYICRESDFMVQLFLRQVCF